MTLWGDYTSSIAPYNKILLCFYVVKCQRKWGATPLCTWGVIFLNTPLVLRHPEDFNFYMIYSRYTNVPTILYVLLYICLLVPHLIRTIVFKLKLYHVIYYIIVAKRQMYMY